MARIVSVELFELELPFRRPFRHAAAERVTSGSIFASFTTDTGHTGYGETLPRAYVTGEDSAATFDLLAERVLPRIVGMEFGSFRELYDFLVGCDGKAPTEWVETELPQTAAWCLVDLGLLDAVSRSLGVELGDALAAADERLTPAAPPEGLRYSLVVSEDSGLGSISTLLKARLYGLRDAKLKVTRGDATPVRRARRILGRKARLRADSNMAWDADEARSAMTELARHGVECFEQPICADDLAGMARLVAETGLDVMADESFHDAASLERLIETRACTAVNVRIAKCGGLVAAIARCRRAIEAGLTLQIGCQVGETSHLSAAQMMLVHLFGENIRYLEGCYGERLLRDDPVRPLLEFGRGGRPPGLPTGAGFGDAVDMQTVRRYSRRSAELGAEPSEPEE